MAPIFVGFFRELEPSAKRELPSAKESAGLLPEEMVQRVLGYLRLGEPFIDSLLAQRDPIDGRLMIPGGLTPVSDGIWVWPDHLCYLNMIA